MFEKDSAGHQAAAEKNKDSQRRTGLYKTQAVTTEAGAAQTRAIFPDQEFEAATAQTKSFLPGDIIDRDYQLTAVLGRGGMGVVFACHHKVLNTNYALKLLSSQLNQEAWTRFQSEAKALARLNHPGIVRIHNMGVHENNYPYYVMDLLKGETLDVLISRQGALRIKDAMRMFIQAADALNSAHANGIIHRDIKPSNLMLSRDDEKRIMQIKIVDFGIARIARTNLEKQSQTATGLVFGTPYYMSPEQCLGQKTDARSDIYSFGCALYEALTGRVPFQGDNAFATFLLHQTEPAPTLAAGLATDQFSEDLEKAVAKMLAKKMDDRYQTMAAVKHDLERILSDKPILEKAINREGSLASHPANRSIAAGQGEGGKALSTSAKVAIAGLTVTMMGLATFLVIGIQTHRLDKYTERIFFEKDREKSIQRTSKPKAVDDLTALGGHRHDHEAEAEMTPEEKETKETATEMLVHLSTSVAPEKEMRRLGYTDEDVEKTQSYPYRNVSRDADIFRKRLRDYLKVRVINGAKFRSHGGFQGFIFPNTVSIGGIKINDKAPVRAIGIVKAPADARVCLYLETASESCPSLFEQFGPDDISGLEIRWEHPEHAIKAIEGWHNIQEISLFNSIIKAPLGMDYLDQCPMPDSYLAEFEKFPRLRSLGLAGPDLTANAVVAMPVLKRLHALKLKSFSDIDALLRKLPPFDNLDELWLVHCETTTKQLQPLTRMANLKHLTIKLSPLETSSLSTFQKMKNLRTLTLDRNWSDAEKKKFKEGLPNCKVEFVPVCDRTFWNLLN